MKFRWDKKYLYWGITAFLTIVCSIAFFLMLNNISSVVSAFKTLFEILVPFTFAFTFAYLLNPVVNFFEKKLTIPFCKWLDEKKTQRQAATPQKGKKAVKVSAKANKLPRVLSILFSLTITLLVICGLILMVLPQLIDTIIGIVNNLPVYLENFQEWVVTLVESNAGLKEMLATELASINQNILDWAKANLLPQLNSILSGITVGVLGALNFIKNIVIGIIVSIYVLYSKERFSAQAKKVIFAIFPVRTGNTLLKTARRADKVFGGFIIGKLIDSAIIGIICFVGMNLFNLVSPVDMPFSILISVIIGVTNIIPFFGPFIGAIPCILLILIVNPLAALYFAIFVLLLQQFDGNILGPKILGNSTGLSAFWVMFAILLGGGLFGFTGMLLGVPTFAVIYTIITELIEAHLKRHRLPSTTEEYYSIDVINSESKANTSNDKE